MTTKKLRALNNNNAVETIAEAAPASLDAGKPPLIAEAAAPIAEEKPARKLAAAPCFSALPPSC